MTWVRPKPSENSEFDRKKSDTQYARFPTEQESAGPYVVWLAVKETAVAVADDRMQFEPCSPAANVSVLTECPSNVNISHQLRRNLAINCLFPIISYVPVHTSRSHHGEAGSIVA